MHLLQKPRTAFIKCEEAKNEEHETLPARLVKALGFIMEPSAIPDYTTQHQREPHGPGAFDLFIAHFK